MIHYHGTPVGGPRGEVASFLTGRHAFVSFASMEDIGVALEVCQSVALDNGAFSVWKRGGSVDVEAFCEWVSSVMQHPSFDWAIIPDVIDGTEEDNDSLVAMWPHGRAFGVPVWHLHESLERLRRLVTEWPRVALGSSGRWATPGRDAWWRRMEDAMKVACD